MDKQVRLLFLLSLLPATAAAQNPQPLPARPPIFEALSDSQWIRVSRTGHSPREARLLEHSATEMVLDLEPRPLRIPVSSIDTLWERRTASKTGALVGGLLGAGVGILAATQTVEKGETPPAGWVGVFAIGGAAGVGCSAPWSAVPSRDGIGCTLESHRAVSSNPGQEPDAASNSIPLRRLY